MDSTTAIIITFVVGYVLIAFESFIRVNKAAIALLMCVACWTIYALDGSGLCSGGLLGEDISRGLGDAGATLFFLMGAMAIVEIVDQHGGFNFVRYVLASCTKQGLLWKLGSMTFILSAVLDNLTTSIVMVMILRKLVDEPSDRLWYASCIIIAANAGGAFSPIGDVTTIMLWNGGMVTAPGLVRQLLPASILAFVVPTFIMQFRLRGPLSQPHCPDCAIEPYTPLLCRILLTLIGIGGLCCVPLFHSVTGLPPFVGILLVLGVLWFFTEFLYWHSPSDTPRRVVHLLSHIDLATILFFLGILMSVTVLSQTGVLTDLGRWFDHAIGNDYLIATAIGALSSVIDNVPLVAGAMKMYAINAADASLRVDGVFWQMLAYCAGTGGSLLVIGSAAGVVVMGLEHISFGWYLRRITPLACLGFLCGILCYWLMQVL